MSDGNPFERIPARPLLAETPFRPPPTGFPTDAETRERIVNMVAYTGEQLERVVNEGTLAPDLLERYTRIGRKASIQVVASNDLPVGTVMQYHAAAHQISVTPEFEQPQITWGLLAASGGFKDGVVARDSLCFMTGVVLQDHPDGAQCDRTAGGERAVMEATYMLAGVTRHQVSACFATHGTRWRNDLELAALMQEKIGINLPGEVSNRVHRVQLTILVNQGESAPDAGAFQAQVLAARHTALRTVSEELGEIRLATGEVYVTPDGAITYDIDRARLAAVARKILGA